jgi:phosphatidylserine synthase
MSNLSEDGQEPKRHRFSSKIATVLAFSRPLIVFGGVIRAIAVIWKQNPVANGDSIFGDGRKYGRACLDELCMGNEGLRRRILAIFPNALTVMNAMMGLIAVFFAYQGRVRKSYLMLIGAAVFDKLDGMVARRLGLTASLPDDVGKRKISLGNLMDDFADAVSFCIVPGWIFYIVMTDFATGRLSHLAAGLVGLLYATMGIVRLIYFTLDKDPVPGFFKGMPTAAAALLVVTPLIMLAQVYPTSPRWSVFWGYIAFCLVLFSALLMNCYFIRYLHMGRCMSRNPWITRLVLVVLLSVVTPYFGLICLIVMILYTLSPLVTWRIDPEEAARETRVETLRSG